jgi:transcription termination/antitermination protein NusG
MTNQYAIRTTTGREFAVEQELKDMGLHPYAPRALAQKWVKEKGEWVWYDAPYLPGVIFCVVPAVYFADVCAIDEVWGKPLELTRLDVEGCPATDSQPARVGLQQFCAAVEAEYSDAQRLKGNSEYKCQHKPGDALKILSGPFCDFFGKFDRVVREDHHDHPHLRLLVDIFGRETPVEVAPDMVGVE